MSWPDDVRVQAMVASKRSCCICHKFCGGKLEIHHIEQKAVGGKNTLENCIPLCFECHADVGHYNDNHPKGTKFTSRELRAHKDNWFKKVRQSDSPAYDETLRAIDVRIATEIHTMMMREEGYLFLRLHSLWAAYWETRTEHLFRLAYLLNFPDYQFNDAVLENQRSSFFDLLDKSVNKIALMTGPSRGNPALFNVCSDLEFIDMDRDRQEHIRAEIEAADNLNARTAEAYERLYYLVRERLGLDLRFTSPTHQD